MRVLVLLALGEVSLVRRIFGMMLRRFLAFREAPLMPRLGSLFAGCEIAFLFLSLGVMLGRLLPGSERSLMPVLILGGCGGRRCWTLVSHGDLLFSLSALRSLVGLQGTPVDAAAGAAGSPFQDEI